jgi:hypothetical protein
VTPGSAVEAAPTLTATASVARARPSSFIG